MTLKREKKKEGAGVVTKQNNKENACLWSDGIKGKFSVYFERVKIVPSEVLGKAGRA
jgi:hypothetical protein